MIFTNKEIYQIAECLTKAFNNPTDKIPVLFYFYIEKNKQLFIKLALEIEQMKINICNTYGDYNKEKDIYSFSEKNKKIANNELENLFSLTQKVDYYTFSLNDIKKYNLILTAEQTEAIMFMIREEGDEKLNDFNDGANS